MKPTGNQIIEFERALINFAFTRAHDDMANVDWIASDIINSNGIKDVGDDGFKLSYVIWDKLKFEYFCLNDKESIFDEDGDLVDATGDYVTIQITSDDTYENGFAISRETI